MYEENSQLPNRKDVCDETKDKKKEAKAFVRESFTKTKTGTISHFSVFKKVE